MKIAIATAAALLVASSMAYADKGGDKGGNGGRDGRMDNMTTGSINRDRNDIDDQEACRNHEWGGPLCGEMGHETRR